MAPSIIEIHDSSPISTRHISSAAPKAIEASSSTTPSNSDTHLAKLFKSDLTTIRGLITCTICDQLLYEPWTLACGHTYCYSCLCQWFKQHQHRKTCPDCRTAVTVMPAPSFTIKQMIEIFISRAELLPPDETTAQHRENIESERMAVDVDKTTEDGLFKGCFKHSHRVHRQWNEEDGLYRCSGCHHEYTGHRRCEYCNELFEHSALSDDEFLDDIDSFDGDEGPELYDIEVDDVRDSDDSDDDSSQWHDQRPYLRNHLMQVHGFQEPRGHPFHGHVINLESDDEDDEDDDDEEESESLRNFIVDDSSARDLVAPADMDRSSRAASEDIHIALNSSNYDSEEEEDIIQHRRRNRNMQRSHRNLSESISSENSDEDTNTSISSRSVSANQPSQGDSESENNYEYGYGGYSPLQGSDDGAEESNSDTIQELDHDDVFRTRNSSSSSTPRHSRSISSTSSMYGYEMDNSDNEIDQYDRDGDGDVEMSLSPERSGASVVSDSDQSDSSSRRTPRFSSEDLGPAAVFEEDGDEDSDDSIRPPVRRRRPALNISAAHDEDHMTITPRLFARPQTPPAGRRRQALNTAARAHNEDEDVTLTQLFTRPPTGRRTSPTLDAQRILEWHASMRSSPAQPHRHSASQSRRVFASTPSSARPSRGIFQHPARGDRVHMRSHYFMG